MSFKLDTSEFERAIGFVVQASGKDCADVLNRAALVALIGGKGVKGALQRTPAADKERIRGKLINDALALKIVMARARRKGEKLKRPEIARRAKRLIQQRMSAVNYTRGPGWNNAIRAFGGRGVRTSKRFAASDARYGAGSKASPQQLKARIVNTAPAAEKIGFAPLQAALMDTARDLVEYGTRKLQQTFNKVKP